MRTTIANSWSRLPRLIQIAIIVLLIVILPSAINVIERSTNFGLLTQVNRALIRATVVIDLDRVEGRLLDSVAAYAAFVAFAEIRPSEPPPAGSILELFGTAAGAPGVTDWDMAFLRALYRMPLDRQARRHRGLLVREMVGFQTGG